MTESMIERVARAIAKSDPTLQGQFDDNEFGDLAWRDWRQAYLPQARAAIEAMREPTDAMVDAALGATGIYEDGSNDYLVHYQSMIDAALLEQQP